MCEVILIFIWNTSITCEEMWWKAIQEAVCWEWFHPLASVQTSVDCGCCLKCSVLHKIKYTTGSFLTGQIKQKLRSLLAHLSLLVRFKLLVVTSRMVHSSKYRGNLWTRFGKASFTRIIETWLFRDYNLVISRGLLAVLYEKTVRGGGEEKWQPLLCQCFSPDGLLPCSVSTGWLLLLVASMGQVWRNWRLFCSGTSFRCVFSLQSSCCIPLPQAFASPKWLSPDIAVSLLSCLFRVWPGHSLKTANSRVLYYPLVGPKLC